MAMPTSTCYYDPDGIYHSPWPQISFPSNPSLTAVAFLFRNAASYPNRLAVIDADSGESLTFAALRSAVHSAAAGFLQLGITKGSFALIAAPNSIHFLVSFLAVIAAGAIPTTINPSSTVREISHHVQDSGAKWLLTTPHLWNKVRPLGLPTIFLGTNRSPAGEDILYLQDLLSLPESDYRPPAAHESDGAVLFYSSGTTGRSKGVLCTHRNLVCAALMETNDQDLRSERPNTFICFVPLFHVYGLCCVTYAQLQRGNSVVLMAKYDLEAVLRSIERHRVSHLSVTPHVMLHLSKLGKAAISIYDVSSLSLLLCAGARLPLKLLQQVQALFPDAIIIQGYGLTEATGFISKERADGKKIGDFGSAGYLVPGIDAKVLHLGTLKSLPPNHIGELCFRGPNFVQGYLNNANATKQGLGDEGWVHSGDLGYFDAHGQIFIVDRIKEMIKYKGFQVAPAEIEGLLVSHPEILDAAVIPFPDEEAGEVPIAFVVRQPSSSLAEIDVQKFIANQARPSYLLLIYAYNVTVPNHKPYSLGNALPGYYNAMKTGYSALHSSWSPTPSHVFLVATVPPKVPCAVFNSLEATGFCHGVPLFFFLLRELP